MERISNINDKLKRERDRERERETERETEKARKQRWREEGHNYQSMI